MIFVADDNRIEPQNLWERKNNTNLNKIGIQFLKSLLPFLILLFSCKTGKSQCNKEFEVDSLIKQFITDTKHDFHLGDSFIICLNYKFAPNNLNAQDIRRIERQTKIKINKRKLKWCSDFKFSKYDLTVNSVLPFSLDTLNLLFDLMIMDSNFKKFISNKIVDSLFASGIEDKKIALFRLYELLIIDKKFCVISYAVDDYTTRRPIKCIYKFEKKRWKYLCKIWEGDI